MNSVKELSFGELLDKAIRLYTGNFWPLIAISALTLIPNLAFTAVMPRQPGQTAAFPLPMANGLGLSAVLIGLGLVSLFVNGALTKAIADAYLQDTVQVNEAFKTSRKRYFSLLGTGLLAFLAMGFGFVLLVIPGIYLSVVYTFAVPVVVLEGLSGLSALRRSYNLVKGAWWRVAGVIFVLSLLSWVIQFALSIPAMIIGVIGIALPVLAPSLALISRTLQAFVSVVITPLIVIGTTLLYFDQRVRKEGFDLWLSADAINIPESEPVS